MIRVSAIVVGLFLAALFFAGLSLQSAAWLTWLDGLGAVLAFVVAAMPDTAGAEGASTRAIIGGIVSLGLFALWIIGLVVNVQPWLVWCTFAAAIGMALVALGGGTTVTRRAA